MWRSVRRACSRSERGGGGGGAAPPPKRPLSMASSSSGVQNRIAKLVACMSSHATPRYQTDHSRSGAARAGHGRLWKCGACACLQARCSPAGALPVAVSPLHVGRRGRELQATHAVEQWRSDTP